MDVTAVGCRHTLPGIPAAGLSLGACATMPTTMVSQTVLQSTFGMTSSAARAAAEIVHPQDGLSFIEQLHAASLRVCSNAPSRWMIGTDSDTMTCMVCRPACKRWSCPECAARNARRWIARVINGVNQLDGDWFMFTLTSHEHWRGSRTVPNLRQGWKKLYNRMRRKFGTNHYVKVWELHSDKQSFHLHGLIDTYVGHRWIKDNARECGMGYQVDFHNVDNAGKVAGYIAKYFLKSEGVLKDEPDAWVKNLRRIETDRDWPELPELEQMSRFDWQITQTEDGALRTAEYRRQQGYRVISLL